MLNVKRRVTNHINLTMNQCQLSATEKRNIRFFCTFFNVKLNLIKTGGPMSKNLIQLTIISNIANVTLNRSDKLNALNFKMFKELDNVIKKIKKDKSIRAVVIRGKGTDFCTGLDIKTIINKPLDVVKLLFKWLPGNANLAQRVTLGWQDLPIPVIAQIQGRCWGGAMQIVLGADYRIAHTDSSLAIMESRWGLCPDMGASLQLAKLLPYDQALLLSSNAEPITASEAEKINLISLCTDNTEQQTQLLLNQLIAKSPDTLAAIKRLYQTSHGTNRRKTLARETFNQIKLLLKKNTKKAIKSSADNSNQNFSNRGIW